VDRTSSERQRKFQATQRDRAVVPVSPSLRRVRRLSQLSHRHPSRCRDSCRSFPASHPYICRSPPRSPGH